MASDICYVCGTCNMRGSVCLTCCPDGDPRLKPATTPVAPVSPDAAFIEAARWHEAEAERKRSVAVKSKRLEAQIATHEASAAHFRSAAPVSPDATGKCGELETVGYVHRGTIGLLMEGAVSKAVIVPNAGGDFKTPVMLVEQAVELLAAERAEKEELDAECRVLAKRCIEKDARIKELERINANLMGDDEDKPRYTTKRLKLEIARATEAIEVRLAAAEKALETKSAANEALSKSVVESIDTEKRLREALTEIASFTQTTDLLWWQQRARVALEVLK